jgi:hypothetical protein
MEENVTQKLQNSPLKNVKKISNKKEARKSGNDDDEIVEKRHSSRFGDVMNDINQKRQRDRNYKDILDDFEDEKSSKSSKSSKKIQNDEKIEKKKSDKKDKKDKKGEKSDKKDKKDKSDKSNKSDKKSSEKFGKIDKIEKAIEKAISKVSKSKQNDNQIPNNANKIEGIKKSPRIDKIVNKSPKNPTEITPQKTDKKAPKAALKPSSSSAVTILVSHADRGELDDKNKCQISPKKGEISSSKNSKISKQNKTFLTTTSDGDDDDDDDDDDDGMHNYNNGGDLFNTTTRTTRSSKSLKNGKKRDKIDQTQKSTQNEKNNDKNNSKKLIKNSDYFHSPLSFFVSKIITSGQFTQAQYRSLILKARGIKSSYFCTFCGVYIDGIRPHASQHYNFFKNSFFLFDQNLEALECQYCQLSYPNTSSLGLHSASDACLGVNSNGVDGMGICGDGDNNEGNKMGEKNQILPENKQLRKSTRLALRLSCPDGDDDAAEGSSSVKNIVTRPLSQRRSNNHDKMDDELLFEDLNLNLDQKNSFENNRIGQGEDTMTDLPLAVDDTVNCIDMDDAGEANQKKNKKTPVPKASAKKKNNTKKEGEKNKNKNKNDENNQTIDNFSSQSSMRDGVDGDHGDHTTIPSYLSSQSPGFNPLPPPPSRVNQSNIFNLSSFLHDKKGNGNNIAPFQVDIYDEDPFDMHSPLIQGSVSLESPTKLNLNSAAVNSDDKNGQDEISGRKNKNSVNNDANNHNNNHNNHNNKNFSSQSSIFSSDSSSQSVSHASSFPSSSSSSPHSSPSHSGSPSLNNEFINANIDTNFSNFKLDKLEKNNFDEKIVVNSHTKQPVEGIIIEDDQCIGQSTNLGSNADSIQNDTLILKRIERGVKKFEKEKNVEKVQIEEFPPSIENKIDNELKGGNVDKNFDKTQTNSKIPPNFIEQNEQNDKKNLTGIESTRITTPPPPPPKPNPPQRTIRIVSNLDKPQSECFDHDPFSM